MMHGQKTSKFCTDVSEKPMGSHLQESSSPRNLLDPRRRDR